MNYFLFSFFVGGFLTLIPSVRNVFNAFLQALNFGFLMPWEMFVAGGVLFSLIFFVSKDYIAKNGYIAFWKVVGLITIFTLGLGLTLL